MRSQTVFVAILFLAFGKMAQAQILSPAVQPFSRPDNSFFNPATLELPDVLKIADSPILKSTVYLGGRNHRFGAGLHLGNGVVITNAHVLSDLFGSSKFAQTQGENLGLGFPNSYELYQGATVQRLPIFTAKDLEFLRTYNASFEDAIQLNDWAELNMPGLANEKSMVTIEPSVSNLTVGETVWILGYPMSGNEGLFVAAGNLKQDPLGNFYISNTQLQGGFSGGPVIRANGHVIGIVNTYFKATGNATIVPINKITGIPTERRGLQIDSNAPKNCASKTGPLSIRQISL